MPQGFPVKSSGGQWYGRFGLSVSSIVSAEAFGVPTVDRGPLTLRPNGIPSAEAIGSPLFTFPQFAYLTGIPSSEAFGTALIRSSFSPVSIPSAETFGSPTVTVGPVALTPAGIPSAEAFGTAKVSYVVIITAGISSAEVVPSPKVGRNVGATGIASAEAFGTATVNRGPVSITASGIPSAEAFGTATLTQPATVNYNTQGVGTETTSTTATCTINPNAGDDVIVFYSVGSGGVTSATYGASNLPMICAGQALSNGVLIVAYVIRGVAAGSATITVNKTGSSWGQAVAVSYSGAQGCGPAKQVVGNSNSFSQPVSVPLNGRTVHAFTPGENSTTLSGLTGGVSRYLDNAGFLTQSVRDADAATTFAGTLSAVRDWAALAIPLSATAPGGVLHGFSSGTATEGLNNTKTFDVVAALGDYVYCVVAQDRAGNPSAVTCAGTAMTLLDTETFTTGVGTGFIKLYRSSAAMDSAGTKTVSVTGTGSGWYRAAGLAVSGVTSPSGVVTKTSGTSSQPSQAVTCAANELILQIMATSSTPSGTEGGSALFLSPTGSQIRLILNIASESTTFKLANTSINWGAMALVLS
ncbi:Uncharacterised protein [Mycobacteroides abscessus subsp. bolletii]|uniref:hypothetical protein n=1 Tax=Mycobacteroides abscessus TaxID=36809 RepID=UPI0009CC6FE8|nr:hypothetical protein [Mycobacteroides abscessus]SKR94562.1 Uncharacterised protein [Mycobacteroides abscessus subsp. bolletii]SKS02905.1 Uncharacterised protein [Mycobacteroides abscessus subsp. bolletii]DAZ90160.1 TPA_asm: minor tail protein [Mycobacterium phage prophiFVLQ01-1]